MAGVTIPGESKSDTLFKYMTIMPYKTRDICTFRTVLMSAVG